MLMLFLFVTAAIGAAVASSTSSAKSSSADSGGGGLGGASFSGKAYTDESISEGELAERASHGDKAASDELARRQMIKTVNGWCGAVGLGEQCQKYVEAGLDIGNAIVAATSDDLAADANTPEQKARLAKAVGTIMALGFPPTRFTSLQEFGVEEQAATIEEDIAAITHGPTYAAPFMGSISIARMLQDAGAAALVTAGRGGEATDRLNTMFLMLANRRSPIGVMRVERPIYLLDQPVTAASLAATSTSSPVLAGTKTDPGALHAVIAYLACAAAGRFGLSLDRAFEAAAANAAMFNERHGLTSRADALSLDTRIAGYLTTDCGPVILAEVWLALLKAAGDTRVFSLERAAVAPRVGGL